MIDHATEFGGSHNFEIEGCYGFEDLTLIVRTTWHRDCEYMYNDTLEVWLSNEDGEKLIFCGNGDKVPGVEKVEAYHEELAAEWRWEIDSEEDYY